MFTGRAPTAQKASHIVRLPPKDAIVSGSLQSNLHLDGLSKPLQEVMSSTDSGVAGGSVKVRGLFCA